MPSFNYRKKLFVVIACVTSYERSCRINDCPRSWPILLRIYSGVSDD